MVKTKNGMQFYLINQLIKNQNKQKILFIEITMTMILTEAHANNRHSSVYMNYLGGNTCHCHEY